LVDFYKPLKLTEIIDVNDLVLANINPDNSYYKPNKLIFKNIQEYGISEIMRTICPHTVILYRSFTINSNKIEISNGADAQLNFLVTSITAIQKAMLSPINNSLNNSKYMTDILNGNIPMKELIGSNILDICAFSHYQYADNFLRSNELYKKIFNSVDQNNSYRARTKKETDIDIGDNEYGTDYTININESSVIISQDKRYVIEDSRSRIPYAEIIIRFASYGCRTNNNIDSWTGKLQIQSIKFTNQIDSVSKKEIMQILLNKNINKFIFVLGEYTLVELINKMKTEILTNTNTNKDYNMKKNIKCFTGNIFAEWISANTFIQYGRVIFFGQFMLDANYIKSVTHDNVFGCDESKMYYFTELNTGILRTSSSNIEIKPQQVKHIKEYIETNNNVKYNKLKVYY